jgi:S-adenosylmethionine:tRNA ribosyltransferase-isomerase
VGIGTFLPVRTEEIDEHVMHEEEFQISEEAAQRINAALRAGRPVVAVGTTSVRTLESAFEPGTGVVPGRRSTDLFIRPGYRFRVVSALVTNFHTPQSTLLVLVAAFAGRQQILDAYREAVDLRYRFFSYGDAMLIL